MEKDFEDFYKILGIDKNTVNYMLTHGEEGVELKESSNERRDRIIKEAYDNKFKAAMEEYQDEIKSIEQNYETQKKLLEEKYEKSIAAKKIGLKNMNNNKVNTIEKIRIKMENEIQQYENKKNILNEKYEEKRTEAIKRYNALIKKIERAFNEIKSPALRDINSSELLRSNIRNHRAICFETAFDFFGISEERINSVLPVKADEMIRDEYIKRMEAYKKALTDDSIPFSKRKKIEALQMSCKQNYELISNLENRKKYSEFLNNEELKEKYSKVSQFRPELIFSDNLGRYSISVVNEKNPEEIVLKNNKSIKKVATLLYKNSTGVMNSYINQYQVKRKIDNEERIDYIYTDLDFQQLNMDENTGIPINPEYYECVTNELLSEEMINASKLNNGYIGLVEKNDSVNDEKGKKYHTTLIEKELHPTEQEYLAAVMIYEKSQKDKKIDIEQESDEGR